MRKKSISLLAKNMLRKYPLFFYSLVIILVGLLVWYYSAILAYVLIAAVLSIIGKPIVHLLQKARIPHLGAVIITIVFMLGVFLSFFMIFIPLFIREAQMISNLDYHRIALAFREPLQEFEQMLIHYNVLDSDETIAHYISTRLESVLSIATFSEVIKGILNATGEFIIGVFAVVFITFFFLKQESMFRNIVLSLTNRKYHPQTVNVMHKSRFLLQRYFTGLLSDIILMITLMSVTMTLFGIHGALLIGFFAGLVIVIPYVGPIIGATMAVVIGLTGALAVNIDTAILPLALKILAIYLSINVLDGVVFQPLIYGKFVKASPLEIFLVILIAGSTGGMMAMIVAVPVYTFVRIVAKEFLSQFRPVEQLTRDL